MSTEFKNGAAMSVVLSVLAAACLMLASEFSSKMVASLIWLVAALAMLACLKTRRTSANVGKLDTLWRELSNSVSDPILLMAAGYCNEWVVKIGGIPVGWAAAVLAVLSSLIRVLGGALTGTQVREGPMASTNRLAVLILASFGSIVELWIRQDGKCAEEVMRWALGLIVVGSIVTCWKRVQSIAATLKSS